jgi:HK97 family phage major capsid protein
MFERAVGDPPAGLLTTGNLGSGLPYRFVLEQPQYPTPLLDLIGVVPLTANSVEYVKYTFTNNAAVVAEGHMKPRSAFARELTPKAIPTVAHWVEASRQLLEDETATRSYIDGELKGGVLVKMEGLAGDALTGATLPTADGAGDLLAGIRMGKAKLPKGYTATAVLLNPEDWAKFDIAMMNSTILGPVITQTFWGMTPVSDPGVTAGTAILGDFARCVKMFRRTEATVYITDSDVGEDGQSNFKRNIFTLLAEARALIDVVDARGLVKVSTGTAPTAPAA